MADPSVENLHEWRKQAKYLRHQLEVLEPIQPVAMAELAGRLHELTQLLGDGHDLAVLRQKLVAGPAAPAGRIRETLVTLIDRRRAELEQEALQLGRRLFADKPKDFTERLKSYWKAWRACTHLAPRH